ncbi:MAG: MBL fold metallo-hydrolase [Myxococcota bacterium]
MELREIACEVYACLQEDRGLGYSNSGLVGRDAGLVVDTFWDLPHTRQLIQHYAEVWRRPASRVVNTHHNGDHCWGNQLFAGAEIIGHRRCREGMLREDPKLLQALATAAEGDDPALRAFARKLSDWDFSGVQTVPPTTVFESRLELESSGIPVRLIHVGPAHTAGDVIVHLPEQRVLFAGDIVFRRCTPIAWEGSTAQWITALDEIERLAPDVVVPGHGPLCGLEGPREMKAYLEYVSTEGRRFFEAGLTVGEAARKLDLGPYADWTEPERLVFNLERVYRELRGEPEDAPIDVVRLFREMYALSCMRHGEPIP